MTDPGGVRAVIAAAAALLAVVLVVVVSGFATLIGISTTLDGTNRGAAGGGSSPGPGVSSIPPAMLTLYRQAATTCPGLDWSILAGIGAAETDHGRSTLPGVRSGENRSGAAGVMQFLEATFQAVVARHPPPPGGAHPPSRYNPHDAVYTAAFYLCDNGASTDLRGAIFAYNHSTSYVEQVLARASRYRDSTRATAQTPRTDAGERWPTESATLPDPTVPAGTLTPRMNALYHALADSGATRGGATCWDPHPQNPTSDHPRGKACDIFFNPADPADVARGWQTARQLAAAHAGYGIHYLIWQGQIWTAERPAWTTYTSGIYGCPNRSNVTGCHYDHLHISVY